MDQQKQSLVMDVLASCVTEFFDSYGVTCTAFEVDEQAVDDGAQAELGSMVGFRGASLRGGLAFVAPVSLVAQLLPVPPNATGHDTQLRDWTAEIANQLIGRFKNKLSAKALDFNVGTPVCFMGKSIRLVFLPDAEGVSLMFHAGDADVRVHLDCTISSEIAACDIQALRIVPEGDVLLF